MEVYVVREPSCRIIANHVVEEDYNKRLSNYSLLPNRYHLSDLCKISTETRAGVPLSLKSDLSSPFVSTYLVGYHQVAKADGKVVVTAYRVELRNHSA